jgi:hypothetical protein
MNVDVAWHTVWDKSCADEMAFRATHLVITLVRPSELTDKSGEDQLADLGKLGVDDSDQRREDGREGKRRSLSTHDGPSEQPLSSD